MRKQLRSGKQVAPRDRLIGRGLSSFRVGVQSLEEHCLERQGRSTDGEQNRLLGAQAISYLLEFRHILRGSPNWQVS